MSNYKNVIILLWQTTVEVLFEAGDSDVAAEEFRSCPVTAAVYKHHHSGQHINSHDQCAT